MNEQLHRLQTIIRDVRSNRSEFIFAADRLIRLVIEAGLDLLPTTEDPVTTPGGYEYTGSKWSKSSCGVSIIRSGEAMENGLRDCCRSIRIGKILIQTDEETGKAQVYYSKFPPLINKRIILLRELEPAVAAHASAVLFFFLAPGVAGPTTAPAQSAKPEVRSTFSAAENGAFRNYFKVLSKARPLACNDVKLPSYCTRS